MENYHGGGWPCAAAIGVAALGGAAIIGGTIVAPGFWASPKTWYAAATLIGGNVALIKELCG